jgi:acyl-CoA synthetase (AMP-forming)/AMP-acid ligase II
VVQGLQAGRDSIFDPLVRRAQTDPGGVFCWLRRRGETEVCRNADIVAEAQRFARAFRARGVARGQIVALVLEPRRELYTAFIGAVLAGGVPTILSPLTRKQDPTIFRHSMAALLERMQPAAVIVSVASAASVDGQQPGLVDLNAIAALGAAADDAPASAEPSDSALLQHSSGTTGLKKGVRLSHRAIFDQVERYAAAIALEPADVIASWLPLYHDMGLVTAFLLPAIKGVPFVSLDPMEWVVKPTTLLAAMAEQRATLCWLPNFAFHHIARSVTEKDAWDLSAIRMTVNCSEPCRIGAFDALAEACAPFGLRRSALQTSYAMAENVFAVTQSVPGAEPRRASLAGYDHIVSSGRPLEATRVDIRRDNGSAAGEAEIGQIVVNSPSLFDGYHRQPEATAARLKADGLWTGDLGFVEAGELFVIGRNDDLINVNGKNIFAHEIEDALSLMAGVVPGRVMAYPDPDEAMGSFQLSVAFEITDEAANRVEMTSRVRREVFAIAGVSPRDVRVLAPGVLVKTSSGKLNRLESLRKLNPPTEDATP